MLVASAENYISLLTNFLNFQDGSYSKGPVDLPVEGFDESKYFLSPTFKFEQVSFVDVIITCLS